MTRNRINVELAIQLYRGSKGADWKGPAKAGWDWVGRELARHEGRSMPYRGHAVALAVYRAMKKMEQQ